MKEVIRIIAKTKQEKKPISLNFVMSRDRGWTQYDEHQLEDIKDVAHIGHCDLDGDLFAVYYHTSNTINIFKGEINDGVYECE